MHGPYVGIVVRPFEEVVDEHGAVVMRVCRALLGPADAQDAWADTFLAALQAYPRLRPDSNVRAWLATIAHRKAIDQLRRRAATRSRSATHPRRHRSTRSPTWTTPTSAPRVQRLPFKQRAAVAYRYLADLPYAEIAVLLDCSEAAARRSAADGIAALRARTATPSRRKARR